MQTEISINTKHGTLVAWVDEGPEGPEIGVMYRTTEGQSTDLFFAQPKGETIAEYIYADVHTEEYTETLSISEAEIYEACQEPFYPDVPEEQKYIMTEAQYGAIAKALRASHLGDIYQIFQKNENDYILDEEEGKAYTLKEGLEMINEGFIDFVKCYEFAKEDIVAYDELMRKYGIYDEKQTCRTK